MHLHKGDEIFRVGTIGQYGGGLELAVLYQAVICIPVRAECNPVAIISENSILCVNRSSTVPEVGIAVIVPFSNEDGIA
jgi:hypothetical protein